MPASPQALADAASFQTFVNCYLREVDAGEWQTADAFRAATGVRFDDGETHVVVLSLPSHELVLAIGVRFRSRVGRHTLTTTHRQRSGERTWRPLDSLSTELALIDALYAHAPRSARRLELISRVVESHQVMARYLEHRLAPERSRHEAARTRFIDAEQSTALGHWLHPTPKSRKGMHGFAHAHYAPELAGRFALHFFAARRGLVRQASLEAMSAEAIACAIACGGVDASRARARVAELGDDYCLLPTHPLQAQWLLHQAHVRARLATNDLVDLGPLGPLFTPTSSVRTLYAEDVGFMVKLSIPVTITNSLRINLATELGDSVWISKLLRVSGLETEVPELVPIEDPAYITVALPDMEETGFEVIFRANPFTEDSRAGATRAVHSIAALIQDPIGEGERSTLDALVRELAAQSSTSLTRASLRFFDAYFRCAVEAPIVVYDRHGIAFEAHQQNMLLELDGAACPVRAYYRDIQGLALSERARAALVSRVPELAQQPKVFEPDDVVRNGFGYYLVFNQLYAVINRFALDGLLDEATLLEAVRTKLIALRARMRGLGAELIDRQLTAKVVPFKGNLLTRVADMDELQSENELALYTTVENPLYESPKDAAAVKPEAARGEGARP